MSARRASAPLALILLCGFAPPAPPAPPQTLAEIPRTDFVAEGVAVTPKDTVLVSGVQGRTVLQLSGHGFKPWLKGQSAGGLFGMAVDAKRNRLWVSETGGPKDFQAGFPREVDVRPHPHIGLSTVSYLFEGSMTHRDSVGSTEVIRPGEVNWMTAGKGITHSERFEDLRAEGGRMNGIQAWVALPTEAEETAPAFAHHGPDDLPTYEGGGMWARLIAGKAFGAQAKVKTHSPMFYVHWALDAGATANLPAEYSERAAYVSQGIVEIDGKQINEGQMAVFAPGMTVPVTAVTPAIVMLLGGEPVGERFIEWNFVASSKDRIAQAKADWRAGRMKLPDADGQEFIPLPPDPPGPAPAMS